MVIINKEITEDEAYEIYLLNQWVEMMSFVDFKKLITNKGHKIIGE